MKKKLFEYIIYLLILIGCIFGTMAFVSLVCRLGAVGSC